MENTAKIYSDLPENFWDTIESYLPNYSTRDDIMHNDILAKYVGEEEISEEDLAWVIENYKNKDNAKVAFEQSCMALYNEALSSQKDITEMEIKNNSTQIITVHKAYENLTDEVRINVLRGFKTWINSELATLTNTSYPNRKFFIEKNYKHNQSPAREYFIDMAIWLMSNTNPTCKDDAQLLEQDFINAMGSKNQ